MFKIVEDNDEEYTDIEEGSDEEDSNSEPSEDNLSEDELELWYERIRKQRENYFNVIKQKSFQISHQFKVGIDWKIFV